MDKQLRATREAVQHLLDQLNEHTASYTLIDVESTACHLSNIVAGTPCHSTCTVCRENSSHEW